MVSSIIVSTIVAANLVSCSEDEFIDGNEPEIIDERGESEDENNQDGDSSSVFSFTERPETLVKLGATLQEVKETEEKAGSIIREEQDAAGYISLIYQTTDEHMPARIYILKKNEDKVKITSVMIVPNEAVWGEDGKPLASFVKMFEADGFRLRVLVDQNGTEIFTFVKEDFDGENEHIEALLEVNGPNNRYTDMACTGISYRRTTVVE